MKIEELFPAGRILEERLGREPFEALPREPGIYRFYDERGALLYVGKAINLRRRLFTYRRALPGQVSRKVSRLISCISSFDYEVTDSDQEAILLENRWIRQKRPPFNHINKTVETYYFVYIRPEPWGLDLQLSMNLDPELGKEHYFGCFKGHGRVRRALGSLIRLLWICENCPPGPHHLPVQLTRKLAPHRFQLQFRESGSFLQSREIHHQITSWMLGESEELTEGLLASGIEAMACETPFARSYIEQCGEMLRIFYRRMLLPHRRIREVCLEGDERLIQQDELDDFLVVSAQK